MPPCRWDSWGRLIAPHTAHFAWANIEGNHEIEVHQYISSLAIRPP
jgi:hypothetical protein